MRSALVRRSENTRQAIAAKPKNDDDDEFITLRSKPSHSKRKETRKGAKKGPKTSRIEMESDSSSGDENRPLRRRERKGKLRRRRRRVRCDVNFSDSGDNGGNVEDDVTTEKKAAPGENDVDSGLASSNFKITDFFGASRLSKSDETIDKEESELPSVADELKQQTILYHKKEKAKAPPTSPCNDDENNDTGFEIVESTHSQRTCAAAISYPSNIKDVLTRLETVQRDLTMELCLPLIVNVVVDEKNAAETTSMEEDSVDEDYRKIMEWEERALNGRRGEIDGDTRSPLFENAECVSEDDDDDDENHSLTHGPASVSEKEKSQSDAQEEEFHSMPSRKRKKRRQVLPVKYEEESPPPPPNDVRLDSSSPPPREVATSSASDVETAFVRRRRRTRKASVVHVDVTEASRRQKRRKSKSKQAKLDRRRVISSSEEEEEEEAKRKKKRKKRKTPSSTADEKKEEPVTTRNKRKGKAPRKYCPILVDPDPSEVKDDDDDVKENDVVPAVQLRNALNLVALLPESELRKRNRAATAATLPDFVPFPEISHVLQLEEEEETNSAEPRGDVKFVDAVSALESERCRSLLPNEFTSSASKSETAFLKEISNSLSEELEKLSAEHPSIECSILYDSLSKRATAAKQSADLPWADEFAPRHSGEIIANTEAVEQMRSWLMEWQGQPSADPSSPPSSPPIEQETKKKRRKRVTERFSVDDDDNFVVLKNRYVDYDDEDDDDEEVEDEGPCKAIVLVGPHGSGKTAAVYACAEELGLKVLELNASTKRTGKVLQARLHEATLSHGVSSKADHFGSQCGTVAHKRRRLEADRPKGGEIVEKSQPPPKAVHPAFASFFKNRKESQASEPKRDQPEKTAAKRSLKTEGKRKKKKLAFDTESSEEVEEVKVVSVKAAKPALLFIDDVEVVFDEDHGFWTSIGNIVETTKRPLILATSDQSVLRNCSFQHQVIQFASPLTNEVSLLATLQLMCLCKGVTVKSRALKALLSFYRGDVRRCLNHLQFWFAIGRRRSSQTSELIVIPPAEAAQRLLIGIPRIHLDFSPVEEKRFQVENNAVALDRLKAIKPNVVFSDAERLLPFSLQGDRNENLKVQLALLQRHCDVLSVSDVLSSSSFGLETGGPWSNCWECPPIADTPRTDDERRTSLDICSALEAASLVYTHSCFQDRCPNSYRYTYPCVFDMVLSGEGGKCERWEMESQLADVLPLNRRCLRRMVSTEILPALRLLCRIEKEKERTWTKRRGFVHRFDGQMDLSLCSKLANSFREE